MLWQVFDFEVFSPSDFAVVVVGFTHEDIEQCTLADAVAGNEGNALPFVHSKTDIAKQYLRPYGFCKVLY